MARIDARAAIRSWLLAAPLVALAWPLASEVAAAAGLGAPVALLLAREAAARVLGAARKLHPPEEARRDRWHRGKTS